MAIFNFESLENQKNKIKLSLQLPLKLRDTWYLIDFKWFKQWQIYVGFENNVVCNDQTFHPGPIDNTPLFQNNSNELKSQLQEEIDYSFLPEEAWNDLVNLYKLRDEKQVIAREVVGYDDTPGKLEIEVYPPYLVLCKYDNMNILKKARFSKFTKIENVENVARKLFQISLERSLRLWEKSINNSFEPLKPHDTIKDASISTGSYIVIEEKTIDGTWPFQSKLAPTQQILSSPLTRSSVSAMSSPYEGGSKTSGHAGLCGLNNLGNTCFMNSAIQCMSNVPLLTEYFLSGKWESELNRENPLGMHGEIARTYAELIAAMWSGKISCTAPRQFKVAVGRFKPEFSGYQQQDSQELMAFLLDGLHEDLNRIRKKPYIETKETDNRPDPEVADETWNDYIKRNNSIIVDTFHGLLKSTLVCPVCTKVSVKFDPFCYLSLPLPVKKEKQMEILFVSDDPSIRHKKMKVVVAKFGSITDLCNAVSQINKISLNRMRVSEVYEHRFHKIFNANDSLNSITDKDVIYIYEFGSLDKNKKNSSSFLIPVYMREIRNTVQSQNKLFGFPIFICIQNTVCSFDEIYQKILEKISRCIKKDIDLNRCMEDNDKETSENMEEDDYQENFKLASEGPENPDKISGLENVEIESCLDNEKKNQSNYLFDISLINSYGSMDIHRFTTNETNINFSGVTYLSADWSPQNKKLYFDDNEANAFEVDSGFENKQISKKSIHLSDCLELFTTMEQLGEQDPWLCPVCKEHKQATKKFDLWKLPDILVIHLKRFSYNRYWRDKIDTLIDYPIEGLDLSDFIINPNHGSAIYDLIAVSNHYGGLGGGHYTACAKNKNLNRWFDFDDSGVSLSNENNVVTKAGYVLVYQARKNLIENHNKSSVVNKETKSNLNNNTMQTSPPVLTPNVSPESKGTFVNNSDVASGLGNNFKLSGVSGVKIDGVVIKNKNKADSPDTNDHPPSYDECMETC